MQKFYQTLISLKAWNKTYKKFHSAIRKNFSTFFRGNEHLNNGFFSATDKISSCSILFEITVHASTTTKNILASIQKLFY